MHTRDSASAQARYFFLYRDLLICFVLFQFFVPSVIALFLGGLGLESNYTQLLQGDSNFTLQMILLFILVNSFLVARLCRVQFQFVIFALLPAALMMGWILLSIFWSHYPDLTLRRGVRAFIELLFTVLLALSSRKDQTTLRTLFVAFFTINLLDLANLAVMSLSSVPIPFEGIHGQKNFTGLFFFLALPIFIVGIFDRTVARSKFTAIFATLTAAPMLMLSLSKTSMGSLVMCAGLVFLTRLSLAPNTYARTMALFICVLITGLIAILVFDPGISTLLNLFFGDSTLTGRDRVWQLALEKFSGTNPLLGIGYGALWATGVNLEEFLRFSQFGWFVAEAHNGYLDVMVQLGYIGLFLLILFIFLTFKRILRCNRHLERERFTGLRDYALYVFWGSLIFNITETSFFMSAQPLFFMLIFVSSIVTRYPQMSPESHRFAPRTILPRRRHR